MEAATVEPKGKKQKRIKMDTGWMNRMATFEVKCGETFEQYKNELKSIRYYRQIFNKFLGIIAYTEAICTEPKVSKDKSAVYLSGNPKSTSELFQLLYGGKHNGKRYYELRPLFFEILKDLNDAAMKTDGAFVPNYLPSVWDEFSKDLNRVSSQQDAILKIPRNILLQNGRRDPVRVSRIGVPVKHYLDICEGQAEFIETKDRKVIRLCWDRNIGPVEFVVQGKYKNKKDEEYSIIPNPGVQYVFHKIAIKEWTFQTPYITEHDGDLSITFSYKRPAKKECVNPNRHLEVTFHDENVKNFIGMEVRKDINTRKLDSVQAEWIPANDLLYQWQRMNAQFLRREAERKACPKWEKGFMATRREAVVEHLHRITDAKADMVKHQLHTWANRILKKAVQMECGVIDIFDLPTTFMKSVTALKSFNWSEFKRCMDYKAEEAGIKLNWNEVKDTKKAIDDAFGGSAE